MRVGAKWSEVEPRHDRVRIGACRHAARSSRGDGGVRRPWHYHETRMSDRVIDADGTCLQALRGGQSSRIRPRRRSGRLLRLVFEGGRLAAPGPAISSCRGSLRRQVGGNWHREQVRSGDQGGNSGRPYLSTFAGLALNRCPAARDRRRDRRYDRGAITSAPRSPGPCSARWPARAMRYSRAGGGDLPRRIPETPSIRGETCLPAVPGPASPRPQPGATRGHGRRNEQTARARASCGRATGDRVPPMDLVSINRLITIPTFAAWRLERAIATAEARTSDRVSGTCRVVRQDPAT